MRAGALMRAVHDVPDEQPLCPYSEHRAGCVRPAPWHIVSLSEGIVKTEQSRLAGPTHDWPVTFCLNVFFFWLELRAGAGLSLPGVSVQDEISYHIVFAGPHGWREQWALTFGF